MNYLIKVARGAAGTGPRGPGERSERRQGPDSPRLSGIASGAGTLQGSDGRHTGSRRGHGEEWPISDRRRYAGTPWTGR